jgi:hypothetical protein
MLGCIFIELLELLEATFGDLCPTIIEVTNDITYTLQSIIYFIAEHSKLAGGIYK